jgi:flagellar biosynthetic protein FlhB
MHSQPLQPKLSKLNPISGMKKFVSLRSFVELVKYLVKIIIVGSIVYKIIEREMTHFPSLIQKSVVDIFLFIASVTFKIFIFVCLALIALAALDYVYLRWQHEKSLRMTKQEVEDERRQTEGDPKIKARIRSIQIEMAQRRLMEASPNADGTDHGQDG